MFWHFTENRACHFVAISPDSRCGKDLGATARNAVLKNTHVLAQCRKFGPYLSNELILRGAATCSPMDTVTCLTRFPSCRRLPQATGIERRSRSGAKELCWGPQYLFGPFRGPNGPLTFPRAGRCEPTLICWAFQGPIWASDHFRVRTKRSDVPSWASQGPKWASDSVSAPNWSGFLAGICGDIG